MVFNLIIPIPTCPSKCSEILLLIAYNFWLQINSFETNDASDSEDGRWGSKTKKKKKNQTEEKLR